MRFLKLFGVVYLTLLTGSWFVSACIWDSNTLSDERKKSPGLADVILGDLSAPLDPVPLRERIAKLQANPRENDAAWWNDLAGAHLRLGEAQAAVDILEDVASRFPEDYGIHANLGTAYHLLGRYQEAEREIARDLEINPNAHAGLEKYHLALLQYLIRSPEYQRRHVYVDEFTSAFLRAQGPLLRVYINEGAEPGTNAVAELEELERAYEISKVEGASTDALLEQMAELDERPAYRSKWNLAQDADFERGIIYMAGLNPKQPACFVMLGFASWKNRDLNLAVLAFEKAVELGSPQTEILQRKIVDIQGHIYEAQRRRMTTVSTLTIGTAFAVVIPIILLLLLIKKFCRTRRR